MNNFTKSSGRAYWHSITNLFCCSPSFRKLQANSFKALILLMFFTLSSGPLFAQTPDLGTGIHAADTEGCMGDLPAPASVSDLMALTNFDACRNSGEAFLLEPIPEVYGQPGEFGVRSGFAVGSTDCSWTYFYVYTLKCNGVATPFTVEYDGGDTTQPTLRKGKVIPPGEKDMPICYAQIPAAHPIEYIASLYEDNCNYLKVSDFVTMRTKSKQDDCKWIVIYVYTIWDHCTEPIEVSITYTGGDTVDPWFTSPLPPKDITVDCDNIPGPVTLDWADNCTTGKLKVKSNDDTSQLGIGCEGGVITRTWEILDNCGNYNEYIQNIKVNPAPLVYFDQTQDINVACEDRATIDGLIQDLHYSNGLDDSRCGINGYAKPTYTIPATSCGSFEVTYTFTDACDYTINASLTVNIIDNINPSIDIAASDMKVECDGDGNVEQYATWLANNGGATASDNCDTDLTWSNNDDTHPFSDECGATGQKTIIFTVTDDCGNESKTYATFFIEDTLAPKVDPAIDFRAICDGEGNTKQYQDWLANNGGATAGDDCSGVTWTHNGPVLQYYKDYYGNWVWEDLTDYPNDFTGGCSTYTGSVQVTFTATDACGLSTSTTATFYIEDSIAPVISTQASDMEVECDGYGNTSEYNNWLNNNGGAIADPDLCSVVKWTHQAYQSGDACDTEFYVVFTASDACGNESTTSATFHINDTSSPAIGKEAQDKIVECDGQGNVAEYQAWLASNGGAQAMDVCSDVHWSNDSASQTFSKDCGFTGSITILFTVADDCGLTNPTNTSSTAATFTIRDTTAPTFTAPDDVTIYKDDTCSYDATPSIYTSIGDVIDASDVCSVNPLKATYSDKLSDYDCPGSNLITRTWSLVDECGNKAYDQVQYIYIIDNTKPVLTGDVAQFNLSNVNACAAPAAPLESDIAAQFSDNCTDPIATLIDTIITSEDQCGWARQFVYEVKDGCGNLYDEHIKVSYWGRDQNAPQPTVGPVATGISGINDCLANAIVANPGADPAKQLALFTDDCTDIKELQYPDLHHITKTGPHIIDNGCKWAFYYEFTVTDDCGNPYVYKEQYSGEDNLAPRLIDPASLNILSVSNIPACVPVAGQTLEGLITQYVDEVAIAELYMECGPNPGDGVIVSQTVVSPVFNNGCEWQVSIEYRVTDYCNNDATAVKVTLSGSDQTMPVLYGARPLTVELDCDSNANQAAFDSWVANHGGAVATDNCDNNLDWSAEIVTGKSITFTCLINNVFEFVTFTEIGIDLDGRTIYDNPISTSSSNSAYTLTYDGSQWNLVGTRLSDDSTFNLSSHPADGLSAPCEPNGDNWTLLQTGCSIVSSICNDPTAKDSCEDVTVVKFTATDDCGNARYTSARFVIEDTTAPTGTAPADVVVECDIPSPNVKDVTHADCNTTIVTFVDDVSDDNFNPEVITRTYRITDACGNSTDVTQTITVEDTIAPLLDCNNISFSVNEKVATTIEFIPPNDQTGFSYGSGGGWDTGRGIVFEVTSDVVVSNVGVWHDVTNQSISFELAKVNQTTGGVTVGQTILASGTSNNVSTTGLEWIDFNFAPLTLLAGNFYHIEFTGSNYDGNQNFFYNNGNVTWTQGVFTLLDGTHSGNAGNTVSPGIHISCPGTVVTYNAPVYSDACDDNPTLELTSGLASGSVFQVGDTIVAYLVTDASGNTATCDFTVTVVSTQPSAPAQAAVDSGAGMTLDFRAYPVPFNKDVNILYNFKFDTDVTIEVYDTKGLLVLRKDVKGYRSGSDMTLPLSIIGSDQLYYVKLITNRGTVIKKIVSSNVNKR